MIIEISMHNNKRMDEILITSIVD